MSERLPVYVDERYHDLVENIVTWLESGPDQSAVTISKRGRSVTSNFTISGSADKIMPWVASTARKLCP